MHTWMLAWFIMLLSKTSEDMHSSYSRVTSATSLLAVATASPLYPDPDPAVKQANDPDNFNAGGEVETMTH